MDRIRKKMKIVAALLVLLITYTSCNQYENVVVKQEIDDTTITTMYDINTFEGLYREGYYGISKSYNGTGEVDDLLPYISSYFGERGIEINEEEVRHFIEETNKYIHYNFDEGLNVLNEEGKISLVQKNILAQLNQKMLRVNSQQDYYLNLDWLDAQVAILELDKDKEALTAYANLLRLDADVTVESVNDNSTRGPCGSCIWQNKWKIFGWGFWISVIVTVFLCISFVNIAMGQNPFLGNPHGPGLGALISLLGCPGGILYTIINLYIDICDHCSFECPNFCSI